MFGTPSRIARVASPQLPALTATIAGGAAATAAPAEAAQTPRLNQASAGVNSPIGGPGVLKSEASTCTAQDLWAEIRLSVFISPLYLYTYTGVAMQRDGAHVLNVGTKICALQAAVSADEPPKPVKVFGRGSKSAPAFGLAALSSPRTPPARPTPAMTPAAAQSGAAVGVSAPPSTAVPGSPAVTAGAPDGKGVAAAPEASATGKRQREIDNG